MGINTVAVIGAGTMGNGIAHTFAQSGFKVALIDMDFFINFPCLVEGLLYS